MTATTSSRRGDRPDASATGRRLALAIADANWFTTENLFREVGRDDVATLLLKCVDYRVAWQSGLPPWAWGRPLSARAPGLWQRDLVLPSGWMKRYPALGMRPISRSIRAWRRAEAPEAPLTLVMSYPFYLHLRDLVRPDRHVYYNVDDYTLYWPAWADAIRALERRAARESDLTICVSRVRADELRAAVPEAADRILHLPHGAPAATIAEHPWERPAPPPDDLAALPGPRIGYVGTLEDRVDWPLLDRLAETFPSASLVLIGKTAPEVSDPWCASRARCLARPNVHLLGWRPQDTIHQYNRAFDVCLIPYRVDHPFNVACNPTKIMDYMGSGRPIVSTALPECRLYSSLFHVAETEDSFLDAVRSVLDSGSDDGRAPLRHAWAREHSCRRVAGRLLDWLSE